MKMTKEEREFFYGPTRENEPRSATPACRRGCVRKWYMDRGFGFISPDDGGPDLWFHATVIVSSIPVGSRNMLRGQIVEFDSGINRRGRIAHSVRPVQADEVSGESNRGGRDDRPSGQDERNRSAVD